MLPNSNKQDKKSHRGGSLSQMEALKNAINSKQGQPLNITEPENDDKSLSFRRNVISEQLNVEKEGMENEFEATGVRANESNYINKVNDEKRCEEPLAEAMSQEEKLKMLSMFGAMYNLSKKSNIRSTQHPIPLEEELRAVNATPLSNHFEDTRNDIGANIFLSDSEEDNEFGNSSYSTDRTQALETMDRQFCLQEQMLEIGKLKDNGESLSFKRNIMPEPLDIQKQTMENKFEATVACANENNYLVNDEKKVSELFNDGLSHRERAKMLSLIRYKLRRESCEGPINYAMEEELRALDIQKQTMENKFEATVACANENNYLVNDEKKVSELFNDELSHRERAKMLSLIRYKLRRESCEGPINYDMEEELRAPYVVTQSNNFEVASNDIAANQIISKSAQDNLSGDSSSVTGNTQALATAVSKVSLQEQVLEISTFKQHKEGKLHVINDIHDVGKENMEKEWKATGARPKESNWRESYMSTSRNKSVDPLGEAVNFDILSQEERQKLLSSICGVISEYSKRPCKRSIRCPWHSEEERRILREKLLSSPTIQQ